MHYVGHLSRSDPLYGYLRLDILPQLGMNGAIRDRTRDALFQKLGALAWFLATLHNRTADHSRVDFSAECTSFDRVTAQLTSGGRIGRDEVQTLYRRRDRWRARGCMWEDRQVLIHGGLRSVWDADRQTCSVTFMARSCSASGPSSWTPIRERIPRR